MTTSFRHRAARGFTLVEMAVVFMIVTLLLGGLIATLNAQFDARNATQTEQTMQLARDALTGFAIRQERLPCPAVENSTNIPTMPPYWVIYAVAGVRDGTATSVAGTGEEAFAAGASSTTNGLCARTTGFLPALTLGIGPTDEKGYLLDGWGNRLLYAVTDGDATNPRAFTTAKKLRTLGFAVTPNLFVCTATPGNAPTDCGVGVPGTRAPAVIVSLGKNYAQVAFGDEAFNNDGDRIFVAHTPGPSFDDQLLWLSENVLYSRMIAASGF